MEPLYTVTSVSNETLEGITDPRPCTLNGIAKFDGPESEHCVYNEYVALRLGRLLNVPLADGVLSQINNETSYVSLQLCTRQKALLNPEESQYPAIAYRYPLEAAALAAFDILIGNYDRYSNFYATMVHQPIFRAFDHSQCLLTLEDDPIDSIRLLASDKLITTAHPFYGCIKQDILESWLSRLQRIDKDFIWRCCYMMRPFKQVTVEIQQQLTEALTTRLKNLPEIISANIERICYQPPKIREVVPKTIEPGKEGVYFCFIHYTPDGNRNHGSSIGLIASNGTDAWSYALGRQGAVEVADIRSIFDVLVEIDGPDDEDAWVYDEWSEWFRNFLTHEARDMTTFSRTVKTLAATGYNLYAIPGGILSVKEGETAKGVLDKFCKSYIPEHLWKE